MIDSSLFLRVIVVLIFLSSLNVKNKQQKKVGDVWAILKVVLNQILLKEMTS